MISKKDMEELFLGIIIGFAIAAAINFLISNSHKQEMVALEKEKLRLEIQLKKNQLKNLQQ